VSTDDAEAPGAIPRILLEEGLLDEARLRYARRVHAKLASGQTLVSVIQELHGLDDTVLRDALRRHRHAIRLGELLVELGHLDPADLEMALRLQREEDGSKRRLGEVLTEHHFIDESELVDVLSVQLGFPLAHPDASRIPRDLRTRLPVKWCAQHDFIPVGLQGERVLVAFANPTDPAQLRAAEQVFGRDKVVPAIARKGAIREALGRLSQGMLSDDGVRLDEARVVDLVDRMLEAAVERGASDIHVEPRKDGLHVRFRQDGVLLPYKDFPLSIAPALASRIKVLAKANIAEKRRHQDGRFYYEFGDQALDLRVSIYVTVHGEKIVLRLLNQDRHLLTLSEIGMAPRMLERFREDALERPSGVVIITGPTGSGKTTTLYSCVSEIKNEEISIITAEDPVEYVMDGVAQCSINPHIDLGFEETLKSIVRQDPDVIVIGEIRDRFSAETAIQAALTGHKVITTFHTEDTIGGLLRLLNMNIEAFLVSSTVVSVVAQRLLRRVCEPCAEEAEPTPAEVRKLGYSGDALSGFRFRKGRGCDACRHTGYRGRIAVFELLVLDTAVRDALLTRATSHEIRRISRESTGLMTLLEDGVLKASRGLTTVDEIVRMLPRLDRPRPLHELRRLIGV